MRHFSSFAFFFFLFWPGPFFLVGFRARAPPPPAPEPAPAVPEVQEPQGTPATETENLVKLCKVWGYTKYMHPAFLLGKKDWDEELLTLIPQVRELTTAEEVNALLHDWFVGLGEIDYGWGTTFLDWSSAEEDKKVFVADTSWTKDAGYLGEELAADFARLPEELPNISMKNAPVSYDRGWRPVYDNEPEHEDAFDDPSFRLLGLFRLWNGMEYFYPYLHLLDRDWTEPLAEQIPNMLAGTDAASYERALWLMARETYDTHVMLVGQSESFVIPVKCIYAEGRVVVKEPMEGFPLERGDVLLSINGQTVEELLADKYGDHPRKENIICSMFGMGILTKEEQVELQILRGGKEMSLSCTAMSDLGSDQPVEPYALLENNIGYFEISQLSITDVQEAVELFRDTQGLVVDLRLYPQSGGVRCLLSYILGKQVAPLTFARPSGAVPGAYVKDYAATYGDDFALGEHYDKPVVVLINEGTGSAGDTFTSVLRAAENTVLMGSNTDGCNGSDRPMPLPGGVWMYFSVMGAYHPDGTQTQRTGIAPDIRVEPTIQGIAEGRDEVLEAAVEYIKMLDKS